MLLPKERAWLRLALWYFEQHRGDHDFQAVAHALGERVQPLPSQFDTHNLAERLTLPGDLDLTT